MDEDDKQIVNEQKHTIENLKKQYHEADAWGMITSMDLHDCDPDIIKNSDNIKQYVEELCERIDMKRFGECVVVDFGEDPKVAGFSMTQLIETSLISGHFANNSNRAFIDIFSCKFYDPFEAAEFTKEFFKASNVNLRYLLRK